MFQFSFALLCGLLMTSAAVQAKKIFPGATSFVMPHPIAMGSSKNLLYYGGPVIEEVRGVTVFWNSKVHSDIQAHMTGFYSDYVNSQHMDWLSEYQTNIKAVDGRDGTNQTIRRGKWIGEFMLNPSTVSRNLQDTQIQAELELQINQGVLPVPDANTLYMIHFPSDIRIQIDGMSSCLSFGGYHFNFKSAKYGNIFYAVLPECGSFRSDVLSSATFVGSHELLEAITDAMPTEGSNPAYPQAWNTAGGEEIADVCPSSPVQFSFPTGRYVISREWSNSRSKCFDGVR